MLVICSFLIIDVQLTKPRAIIIIMSAIGRSLLNTGSYADFHNGRLVAACIQRLPATFMRSSVHLVVMSPTLRFPVRGLHFRTLLHHRPSVLRTKAEPLEDLITMLEDLNRVSQQRLKLKVFDESITNFFKNMVTDTMHEREVHNIFRPDMIHLLMEAKKGRLVHEDKSNDADAGFATVEESFVGKKKVNREWSDSDLIAQAVLFFIAGFETASTAMSFALHELALNPDVQDKLLAEIKENEAKNGGRFDYKTIQNMVYMDMFVSEVLRMWPAAIQLERVCHKDYNLGRPSKEATQDFIVRAGEVIVIPVYSIHRDPKYFPDPEKFDPERFSEENKHKIQPFTYLPFGAGPRNCIGSRFALCEVKVMLYQLLLQMEVSPCAKTCVPSRIARDKFTFTLQGGFWVRLKMRD